MKKENCPFCAHRWIRNSNESPITCPKCRSKYYSQEDLEKKRKKKK